MCDYKYELEDAHMKECEHKHWLKLCCDCGKVIDDKDIDYVAMSSDSTTVYEEIIVE